MDRHPISRGANMAIVHIPQGLNIPRLSDIYWQSQTLAYSRSRAKADCVVNQAIDSTFERESQWSRKQSTVVKSSEIYSQVQTSIEVQNSPWHTVKKTVKKVLEEDIVRYWSDRIKPLLVQGKFTSLLMLENENLTWKSIMYNLPKRVLSFVINASIDSLPSYTNLHTWGKRMTDKCIFCPNTTGTLHHILSNCPTFLNRYEWRHNNILRYMFKIFNRKSAEQSNICRFRRSFYYRRYNPAPHSHNEPTSRYCDSIGRVQGYSNSRVNCPFRD